MSLAFVFSALDRCANQRTDAAWLVAQRAAPDVRVVRFSGDAVRLSGGALVTTAVPVESAVAEVFLGVDGTGAPWFARAEPGADDPAARRADPRELVDLRSLAVSGALPAAELGLLAQARSLLHWHARHAFCAVCGAATAALEGGYRRRCAGCGAEHFPRTDPVAITVVRHEGKLLLGRQRPWPRGMYSALAGFVEPGETLEDAARREVFEEAGVRVGEVRYVGSQPWPFPASLMLGFVGEARSAELAIDAHELEDARWFPAAEVRQMLAHTHPDGLWAAHPIALAHVLVREALGLPAEDAPAAVPPSAAFRVMRQDDNGNRVEIARTNDRAHAEAVATAFEQRGHKQLYWVEPSSAD
ncbi:MAG TPA: NAD(+) diphosphatase [Kofleriaceae bacterium]|nr:NAD(+) diphosphatase [Kofleriaceae bacterium]